MQPSAKNLKTFAHPFPALHFPIDSLKTELPQTYDDRLLQMSSHPIRRKRKSPYYETRGAFHRNYCRVQGDGNNNDLTNRNALLTSITSSTVYIHHNKEVLMFSYICITTSLLDI